jgi:VanZ like protein
MVRRRFAVALAAAAAVILSAPFIQQALTAVSIAWAPQFRALAIAATAVPVGIAVVAALVRIRDRRPARYLALASSLAIGAGYILITGLSFGESFHFVEYGVLAWLFYRSSTSLRAPRASVDGSTSLTVDPELAERVEGRALRSGGDGSIFLLPLLAGVVVGVLDEWFQWFIPIRAGEARDVILNTVASGCGLLFALSVEPPDRLTIALRRESLGRLRRYAGAAVVLFALFFLTVHVGHDVRDPEIGSFRSRYSAGQLAALARDRAERWRVRPPLAQRRLSREDQYLAEALWHVQQRNQAWNAGDVSAAWRENRILETFYAPILDVPTYADRAGHRWPADLRADAAQRPGIYRGPFVSDAYRYPMYVWPDLF